MSSTLSTRHRLAAAAAVAVGLALAGCGGDDGDEAPAASAVTEVTLAPPTTTTPPVDRYTVEPGDNLTRIADRFGTTVDAIVEANGIPDPNVIQPGQVLVIPSR